MKLVLAIASIFCLHGAALAQAAKKPVEFKSATVKVAAAASPQPADGTKPAAAGVVSLSADQASYQGVTLKRLLMAAYDLKPSQISGPAWIDTERYDLVATIPSGTAKEDIPVMLQHLLADRFQITQHTEMKDEPVYVLAMAPTGPKLKPSSSDHAQPPVVYTIGATGVTGMRYAGNTMADFASNLSTQLGRDVTDRTGLAGRFDIALPLDEKDLEPGSKSLPASLVNAVKSVGLKLDPGKLAVKHLIVDSAEKTPVEVTPARVEPAKATPAKVEPAKVTPVGKTPAPNTPDKVTPAIVTPAKVEPAKVTPVEKTPAPKTPDKVTPAIVTPAIVTPAKVEPAKVTPVEKTPALKTPDKVTPAIVTPAIVTPAKVEPAKVTPVEKTPAPKTPEKVTPAKVTPPVTPAKAAPAKETPEVTPEKVPPAEETPVEDSPNND